MDNISNLFIEKDGKKVFIGQNQPDPPKAAGDSSKMECPICHGQFDYLLGDDTKDGGQRGCENCWKPSKSPIARRLGGENNGQTVFD